MRALGLLGDVLLRGYVRWLSPLPGAPRATQRRHGDTHQRPRLLVLRASIGCVPGDPLVIGGSPPYSDVLAISLPYSDIYCEEGLVRVANPHEGEQGVAFSTRFAGSV